MTPEAIVGTGPDAKRKTLEGRGASLAAVAGMKDRGTNRIRAKVVASTGPETLRSFARDRAGEAAVACVDERGVHRGSARHEAIDRNIRDSAAADGPRSGARA